MRIVRIGAGAGYSGDRIEPAQELAEKGDLDYLVFECLAERTIALAQQARQRDPSAGYDPLLEARFRAVLPACKRRGTRIVTNMGAANPLAAAKKVRATARELGLSGLRIAAVLGDAVLDLVRGSDFALEERDGTVRDLGNRIVSANAYLGAGPIAEALANGADVVVTGRASDPALFLGPLLHEFGWSFDDHDALGRGTLVGHLLECAGQITGGYFADPGFKDVPHLARLGFPIGEVAEDGSVVVTKVAGSGGRITAATVKEQLLYEILDPGRYLQPDVVADFTQVAIRELAPDRIEVKGGRGHSPTGQIKVSIGTREGYLGEGQISYAGPGAEARGRLALAIVRERLDLTGLGSGELRFDLIGVNALHGDGPGQGREPYEVRVRVAGRTDTMAEAIRIGNEVETLYTNGPAGGGGVSKTAREVLGIVSTLIPAEHVTSSVEILEA
jgi:hypothetical protein